MGSIQRYSSNRLGYLYDYPLWHVTEITQLQPGDHIAYYRELPYIHTKGYWHHAIIEEVDYEKDKINIIHFQPMYDPKYTGPDKKDVLDEINPSGKVVVTQLFFWEDEIYMVEHEEEDCLPVEEVLARAYSKLGDTDYKLMTNNCEHYAMWCKTGKKCSTQADTTEKVAARAVTTGAIAGAVAAATEKSTSVSKGSRRTWAVAGVLEAGHAIQDIHKASKLKEAGKLSEQEFDELVTKRMVVAMGSTAGSVLGASAGACVAGALGGAVGGVLGQVTGSVMGCAAGYACVEIKKVVNKFDVNEISKKVTNALV